MSDKFKYTVGLNNVGSYQASGRPYIISNLTVPNSGVIATNALEVTFPKVTKFVTVRCDGADLSASCAMRIAFSDGGLDERHSNYFVIQDSSSFSADFRVTKLYLMADDGKDGTATGQVKATIIAGLTNIPALHLTSSWSGSEGIDNNIRLYPGDG